MLFFTKSNKRLLFRELIPTFTKRFTRLLKQSNKPKTQSINLNHKSYLNKLFTWSVPSIHVFLQRMCVPQNYLLMKLKHLLISLFTLSCVGLTNQSVQAQENGIFNALAVGTGASTTGIDFDLAMPITKHFALRAGLSFMPDISINDQVAAYISGYDAPYDMAVNGSLKRTSGQITLSYYPFNRSCFFLTAGAYFGGETMIQINGHSDELGDLVAQSGKAGVIIGNQEIPVDQHGNVCGGLRVQKFRPYVGLGFGRAVPKRRVGFLFELGVQFHGTPEVYTDNGTINLTDVANDDDKYSKVIDKLTVYPMMKFHVNVKLFSLKKKAVQ